MRLQGFARITTAVIIAALTVSSCQTQEDTEKDETEESSQSCKGILTSTAQSAAKKLIDSDSLRTYAPEGGPSEIAKAIIADNTSSGKQTDRDHDLCLIYKGESDLSSAEITFSLADEVPAKGHAASTFTEYKLGSLALAGTRSASLYLACSSSKFSDEGEKPFTLRGEMQNRYEPEGDHHELRKENLTVLHSAGLALAKALYCTDNADLPSSFTMPPEM